MRRKIGPNVLVRRIGWAHIMTTSAFFLIFFMSATLVTLVVGLIVMAGGGRVNEKYSNKLMMARVALQASALTVLVIIFLFSA